ncbi:hypothetical protein DPMN_016242 [Dreissena polymorpha]|uniref:Uncharacterized protein n=1 Tax=Dreissena polymorpha TaxID=45954 RepID=A0A9D4NAW6_DREPO|nr:hypothetical protein DPMN_016242 [Dreissena polymorpha]
MRYSARVPVLSRIPDGVLDKYIRNDRTGPEDRKSMSSKNTCTSQRVSRLCSIHVTFYVVLAAEGSCQWNA